MFKLHYPWNIFFQHFFAKKINWFHSLIQNMHILKVKEETIHFKKKNYTFIFLGGLCHLTSLYRPTLQSTRSSPLNREASFQKLWLYQLIHLQIWQAFQNSTCLNLCFLPCVLICYFSSSLNMGLTESPFFF